MLKQLISNTSLNLLEEAVYNELYASNLYKHLANQCQRLGLFGSAKFFANESADELTHYQKIADFLNDRGAVATIPELPACEAKIANLSDALNAAYDAEFKLMKLYEKWYKTVFPNDPITASFLLFYLDKQASAVGEYADLLQRLALGGDILVFDQEMGG